MKGWTLIGTILFFLAGCAGSGGASSFSSDTGVTLFVEPLVEEVRTAEVLPKPEQGWKALVEEVEVPDDARSARVKGELILHVTIDTSGEIADVKVEKPLGYGCDEAANHVLQQATFEPGTVEGQPVERSLALVFAFDAERRLPFTVKKL